MAPSRWLRQADPLPHSWEVTSDTIAAWVAAQAGASTLTLVKPPGAIGGLTDAHFDRAVPPRVRCDVIPADDLPRLAKVLRGT